MRHFEVSAETLTMKNPVPQAAAIFPDIEGSSFLHGRYGKINPKSSEP
jgi:hypothetical protein